MPFQERSIMSLKLEFVRLVAEGGCSFAELCRRFQISRPTGYRWLQRYHAEGAVGLVEQSRRPHASPASTPDELEAAVVEVRRSHPRWGGWKIRHRLLALGLAEVPSASTCTAILHRHGLIVPREQGPPATHRFERAAPNELWQIDFKGHFALARGRCHPLSVLDDHSRYLLALVACADEADQTVRGVLTTLFRRYGLPWRILTDNGPPWGSSNPAHALTKLGMWLLRLGVEVSHGRPLHPQTQGKVERFHGTLKTDLLNGRGWTDLESSQCAFDAWREVYNRERPHWSLGGEVPTGRYQSSPRPFPDPLPPLEYAPGDERRSVFGTGQIQIKGRQYFISSALRGEVVGLRPSEHDGVLEVRYAHVCVGHLDLRTTRFTPHRSIGGPGLTVTDVSVDL
jgi:transposase InsO family protein